MINNKVENFKHESFGVIDIGRVHCGGSGQVLFGSNVEYHEYIKLSIKRASLRRALNRDCIYGEEEIIEVDLSPVQFAEMISVGMNNGATPCTLARVNGKSMAEVPMVNKRMQHDAEFRQRMKAVGEGLDKLTAKAQDILSGRKPPSKGEKELILNELAMLKQEIESNLPFYHKQFQEEMDKTVVEAKGEVEAFVNRVIISKGLEALGAVAPKILEGGNGNI